MRSFCFYPQVHIDVNQPPLPPVHRLRAEKTRQGRQGAAGPGGDAAGRPVAQPPLQARS